MADVTLRESVEAMRALLRANKYADAYALGRHILHFYPKHIETYTILAQVCLATNDLAGATDLLRRVLSADPENVLGLAGMALISEAQEKHDDALWYLERAYEIQPSNDELRGELLRVRELFYGTAPARVELTPGALARVYARQGYYTQAVNEFRRLLRNDSKRFDARVGLAEALYRAGRTDEAAHIAQQVMADAPFALKPNLILGALWSENQVPEGQQFLQRAHQLDPEHRVARDLLGERFDGSAQPRLPVPGERAEATSPQLTATTPTIVDAEAMRAVELWGEIERAQELASSTQEPLAADKDALETLTMEPAQTIAETASADSLSSLFETAAAMNLAGLEITTAPASEPAASPEPVDDTLREILQAEQEAKVQEQPAPPPEPVAAPPPEPVAAPPPPKPASSFAERVGRKSGERLDTDAIAAAAAALASSIALDKTNQPAPTRRTHPAIPKVRPVIRSAQEKLPKWLYITATPANAPASFEAPPPSTADRIAPIAPAKQNRPDWLVEAQAVREQETRTSSADADLPDWLKPPASEIEKPRAEELPGPGIPTWLQEQAIKIDPPAPSEPQAAVVAVPEWLQDATPAAASQPTAIEPEPLAKEGWTNEPAAKIQEPAWQQAIEQEPPLVRQDEIVETVSIVQAPTEPLSFQEPVVNIEPTRQEQTTRVEAEPMSETPSVVQERAPTQAMPDSATMLQMARDKRDAGDLKGALDLYERVMHRRPNYLDQVSSDLQAIVQTGNAPTTANRLLGEAYAMAGRFKESLEQYRIAMGKS